MGCKVGDIIVVRNYKDHGRSVGRHSFVVLSTDRGQIKSLDYDLVCNVMSSFHSEEHRKKKLTYPGNFEYDASQENVKNGHGKAGYIKAEQFFYFDSTYLDYYVIGNVQPELLRRLFEYIESLDTIDHIIDNLQST